MAVYLVFGLILGLMICLTPALSIFLLVVAVFSFYIVSNKDFDHSEKTFLSSLFIGGILIRLVLLLLIHYGLIWRGFCPGVPANWFDVTEGSIFFDEHNFVTAAREVANGTGDIRQYYFTNAHLYILSCLYRLFGYDPIIGKLINCLLGAVSAIIIYMLGRTVFDRRTASIATLLVMFYPSFILWSITNLRESLMMFLIILFILMIVRWYRKFGFITLFIGIIITLFLGEVRRHYACVYAGVLIFTVFFKFIQSRERKLRRFFCVLLFPGMMLFAFMQSQDIKSASGRIIGQIVRQQHANATASAEASGNYFLFTDEETITEGKSLSFLGSLRAFSKGMFYFLLAPFPWSSSNCLSLFASTQQFLWFIAIPFIYIGIVSVLKERNILGVLILFLLVINTFILAFTEGNVGTLFRHRDVFLPLYFLIAGKGLTYRFFKGV